MKYILNPCTDPWRNMALDEWMLMNGPDEPVFWLWRNEPSVIIGYNQDAEAEVNLDYLREHGIKLARRVTGGGAVYHDLQNLNYSFAGPLDSVHPMFFVNALSALGLQATLTGRNDIFFDGRKISGYARRLWKNRELVHGTLMYDVDIETLTAALDTPASKLHRKGVASVKSRVTNVRDALPRYPGLDSLQAALQEFLSRPGIPARPSPGPALLHDPETVLTPAQLAEVDALAAGKFSSPEWLYGRFS